MGKETKSALDSPIQWCRDAKSELKRVMWPSYSKVQQNTLVVLAYVLTVGVIIWFLDAIYFWIVSLLFK